MWLCAQLRIVAHYCSGMHPWFRLGLFLALAVPARSLPAQGLGFEALVWIRSVPVLVDTARFPDASRDTPYRADALLPASRIVAFYGTPLSTRMGILGEIPRDQMMARLDTVAA